MKILSICFFPPSFYCPLPTAFPRFCQSPILLSPVLLFVFSWVCKILPYKICVNFLWQCDRKLCDCSTNEQKFLSSPTFPPKLYPLPWPGTVSQLQLIEWSQNLLPLTFFSRLSKTPLGERFMMYDVYGIWCIWYVFPAMSLFFFLAIFI